MCKSASMASRSSFESCCQVPIQINWVLDGLTRRQFVDSHVFWAPKVCLIDRAAVLALEAKAVLVRLNVISVQVTQHRGGSRPKEGTNLRRLTMKAARPNDFG